jgi:hypothetical protein
VKPGIDHFDVIAAKQRAQTIVANRAQANEANRQSLARRLAPQASA